MTSERPTLPAVAETADPQVSREALKDLRRFHVDPEAEPGGVPEGVRPAVLVVQGAEGGEEPARSDLSELPLRLLAAAVRDRLPGLHAAFATEAHDLATALEALLESDRRQREASGDEDLGDLGDRFVDPAALTGLVGERRGSTGLPKTQRKRLAEAREALAAFTAESSDLILVHRDAEPAPEGIEGLRLETAYDPCAAAAERFDRAAEGLTRTLAAARRARLACDGKYEPARHDPWLDRLSWRDLTRDELHLLPVVAARLSADWLARGGMTTLSRLLLSGRPVQVLVEVDPAEQPGGPAEPGTDPLSGFRFEAGSLGLGHREAFVQQGSVARPERLAEGFRRALAGGRPGLHVVAVATVAAAALAEAALAGRAHPLFVYDPEAGASWARRMDFGGNPAPAEDWPVVELACRTAAGAEEALDLPVTFVDFALLAPALAGHFRAVPSGVPEAELTPLADALSRAEDEAPALPFVWGLDSEGGLVRLVVSHALLAACRDRLDLWRTLQELAGVRSEYIDEAVEQVRATLEARFVEEREELEARHAEELDAVRRSAAEEVANRMTAALLDLHLPSVVALAGPAPAGGGLATTSFAGRSPDEVAAQLLEMASPATLDPATLDSATLDPDAAPAGGSAVDRMAEELMTLVGSQQDDL